MSGFSPAWLALREPADHAARAPALLRDAAELLGASDDPLAVDLGCGTGSTARAFAAAGASAIRWRLVDADAGLLVEASRRIAGAETVRLDLAARPDLPLAGACLVTASALLDLVSAAWLDDLVARLAAARLPLYAALTYDGRMRFDPPHSLDAAIAAAFDRHQRGDKGLGPALGPAGARSAAARLRAAGFRVEIAPSPWHLGPAEAALAGALVAGIAAAAAEEGSLGAVEVDGWLAWRLARLGQGGVVIGHTDLLARPA